MLNALLWQCDAEDERRTWTRTEDKRQAAPCRCRVQPPAHHCSPLIWRQLHLAIVVDCEVAQIVIVGSRELGAFADLGLLERGALSRAQLSSCSFLLRRYTNGNTLILLKGV